MTYTLANVAGRAARRDLVDYEGELVVAIGRGGKDIDPSDAWDHVVGSTVGQDISDRALVSYLSRVTSLSPGDLIVSGTPDGIGAARGTFLGDGAVVTTRIDGIGTLTNRFIRISDHDVC